MVSCDGLVVGAGTGGSGHNWVVVKTVASPAPHRAARSAVLALLGVAGASAALGLSRVEVEGTSMAPALLPGDRLLLRRRRRGGPLRTGEVVAFSDPRPGQDRLMVKRVARVRGAEVTVLGDNPSSSTDSREFGPLELGSIRWVVVRRYARAAPR